MGCRSHYFPGPGNETSSPVSPSPNVLSTRRLLLYFVRVTVVRRGVQLFFWIPPKHQHRNNNVPPHFFLSSWITFSLVRTGSKTRITKKDQDLTTTSRKKILFLEEIWCGPEFLHRMLSPPSFLSSVAGRSLTYWPIHHRRHRFYRNEEHIPYRSIHKG